MTEYYLAQPNIAQADQCLQCLRHNGPDAEAFTFKQIFAAVKSTTAK